jgi:quinol monooxygenase YgiN
MGVIVICAFRPKPGKADELLKVVSDHLDVLRSQGLATDRQPIVGRSKDGTIVEVFEWVSETAIDDAHRNPVVGQLWARYDACCDYISLRDVAETMSPFPGFEPVN